MTRTRWLHEGFIDVHGNTIVKMVGEYFIWKNTEGMYGVERSEGSKWIPLAPYIYETLEEALDIIEKGFPFLAVKCEECGRYFQRIGGNHLKKHNITTKEYKTKYADAKLWSERYSEENGERKRDEWEDPDSSYNTPEFRDMKRSQLIEMRKPTAPELELLKTLNWLYPKEFEYVGDGQAWFNGEVNANPDILNEKRKIVVEMNGCFWHGCDICGYEDLFGAKIRDAKKRETYEKNGYLPITFWEHELFDTKYIVDVITYFCEERHPDTIQFYDSIKV